MRLVQIFGFHCLLETLKQLEQPLIDYFRSEGLEKKPAIDTMAMTWANLVRDGVGVIFAIVNEDNACGILMGILSPDMLTAKRAALEVFWFVKPECRAYSLDLLREFEQYAKSVGCERVVAGSQFTRLKAMHRMYRQNGYRPFGEVFEKEL